MRLRWFPRIVITIQPPRLLPVEPSLVGRARRHGLAFTPRDVFEHPSVAGLAEIADRAPRAQSQADTGTTDADATGPTPAFALDAGSFLLSAASGWITGVTLDVAGGRV